MTVPLTTGSDDYGKNYYASHLGGAEDYGWESSSWRGFFTSVAERVVALLHPTRTLDVGCAKGLLVQALREKGVDAYGADISQHAVDSAHPDVREFLKVANSVEPIEGSWDLISCIEVLEHMSPMDMELSIDNICAATNLVLISSTPADFNEPSHINVRPLPTWVASFAERGFYRRTDVDLSFITPWAVLFEKADLTARDLAFRYETYAYPMRVELLDKRAALLDSSRRIAELEGGEVRPETVEELDRLREENRSLLTQIREVKQSLLTSRDHAMGTEAAEAGAKRARKEVEKYAHEVTVHRDYLHAELANVIAIKDDLEARLAAEQTKVDAARAAVDSANASLSEMKHDGPSVDEILGSRRWKVGGAVLAPLRLVRKLVRSKS